jgi:hypothetical protein
MRALLLAAAVAVPALAGAQVADGVLQPVAGDEFVNAGQCAGTDTTPVELVWNTHVNTLFVQGGKYRLFASNTQPGTTGTNANFCPETDDAANSVRAAQVGADLDATAQAVTAALEFSPREMVRAAGYDACDATTEKTIYLCVHWYDPSGARNGWAKGSVKLSFTAPAAPVNVSATPGDAALNVSWSAGTGGSVDATEYQVVASTTDARDAAGPHEYARTNSTSFRARGLVNGVPYTVVVYAFSKAGNRSDPSIAATGTPQPVADFWDRYRQSGGPENGGCSGGPGGALALVGTAALLALARRKK